LDGRRARSIPVVGEAQVWLVFSKVSTKPRRSRHRSSHAPGDRILARERADSFGSIDEDAVLAEQLVHVIARRRKLLVHELLHHSLEHVLIRKIHVQTADARPAGVIALAGHVLEDVVTDFALVEAVEKGGESAE